MSEERYRFGLFEFDAVKIELRREGVLVRLQTQPAQLLACLLKHSQQVVSREDLRQAIWGGKTFVDFEGGLNFCVSQLRSALQDDAAQPVYIRTVPKSGYQFIAPVQQITAQEQQGSAEHRTALPRAADRSWRKTAVAVFVVLLAAVGLLGYRLRKVSGQSGTPIVAVARFDNETGDPAFSKFSDALTDNVVERLTTESAGKYRVIGNAKVLRLPREQRDPKAIESSLHAQYLVLGQVQQNGDQVRILAHLIRLSDQTHIWVVRMDQPTKDSPSLEFAAADKIGAQFSARMLDYPDQASSFTSAKH